MFPLIGQKFYFEEQVHHPANTIHRVRTSWLMLARKRFFFLGRHRSSHRRNKCDQWVFTRAHRWYLLGVRGIRDHELRYWFLVLPTDGACWRRQKLEALERRPEQPHLQIPRRALPLRIEQVQSTMRIRRLGGSHQKLCLTIFATISTIRQEPAFWKSQICADALKSWT